MTVAELAKGEGSSVKSILYELSCQTEEAIYLSHLQNAYKTMFGDAESDKGTSDSETSEEEAEDDEKGDDEGGEVYYDILSPEDF